MGTRLLIAGVYICFSVCISQPCVASHKWTSASSSILTFQEKDWKFHAMNLLVIKPGHVES